ncbi:MAG: hypothetical protein CMN76_17610 [Spirochaetaceae bacterium]|nr:hypothetical protein [Spirochaetaceae bacterium]
MILLDQIVVALSGALDGAISALKQDAGRRGSDRIVTVGRRRLDQFKYALIQLKPTADVCEELVEFLVDYLGTSHVGIYLWNESEGTFSLQQEIPGVRHGWRVFEPFLMHMADHDAMVLKDRPVSGLHSDVLQQRDEFFQQTNSDLIVPLVLNESLLGILFIGPPGAIDWTPARMNAISEVRSLVTMALSNSILYARLQGILEHLEEKVKERTRKLEEAQAHLVQSEKMAMLGVMIAGIAHEINTPAGVIFGGSMNLQQNLEGVLNHIPPLLAVLGEDRLKELMEICLEQSRKKIHVSGGFKKKKELQSALAESLPLPIKQKLAAHLVETGMYEKPEDLQSSGVARILESFESLTGNFKGVKGDAKGTSSGELAGSVSASDESAGSVTASGQTSGGEVTVGDGAPGPSSGGNGAVEARLQGLLEFITLVSSTGKNLSNIQGSIESIVRIVRALKSYSHPGQKTFGAARVEEGLNNTLIILSSVWKGQLQVQRDLQETPEIECDADELNQVWTNLLTNAWQAMKGQQDATITVRSRYLENAETRIKEMYESRPGLVSAAVGELKGPAVCIFIEDNGPGIPADHIEKIWDPFFTTKDQGEGSGLGLSIVRRIVEEHGGAIGVRSAASRSRGSGSQQTENPSDSQKPKSSNSESDPAPGHGTAFCVLLPLHQDEQTIKKKEARNKDMQDLRREDRNQSMPFKFR